MPPEIVVHNAEGPDFEFEGECLLEEVGNVVGKITIYGTRGGNYVVRQVRSGTGGRKFTDRAKVFASLGEIPEWLGHSAEVKEMLSKIGYDYRVRID